MDTCNELGIKTFIPRSYIEQVQLEQLTDDFAQMTDKARRHFTVADGSVIDDHVSSSPTSGLLHTPQCSPSRHSVDGSMLTGGIAGSGHHLQHRWRESASMSAPGRSLEGLAMCEENDELLLPALENSGQLRALSQDERMPVEDASRLWAPDRPAGGNRALKPNSITSTASPAPPRTSGWVQSRPSSIDGSVRPSLGSKGPAFWSPNKLPRPGATASALAIMQRELKSITGELHVIAENTSRQYVTSMSVCSVLVGLTAGVAVTLAFTRRS